MASNELGRYKDLSLELLFSNPRMTNDQLDGGLVTLLLPAVVVQNIRIN